MSSPAGVSNTSVSLQQSSILCLFTEVGDSAADL